QGRRQPPAPTRQSRPRPVQHDLQPGQLVAARSARPCRVRTAHREVHGHDQLPLANDHEQQQPIDPQPDAWFLAAPPHAYQPQLPTGLPEQTVIPHPRPWPPTVGRRAFGLEVPPQPDQPRLPQALQALDPLPLRQRAQDATREVVLPAPDPAQLLVAATARHGGETSSPRPCLTASAGLAVATVPLRPRSLAGPTPAGPVHAGAARAPDGGNAAWPVGCASVWHVVSACGRLGGGSWEAPP